MRAGFALIRAPRSENVRIHRNLTAKASGEGWTRWRSGPAHNALAEHAGDFVCATRAALASILSPSAGALREPPQARHAFVDGVGDKTGVAVGDHFRLRRTIERDRS